MWAQIPFSLSTPHVQDPWESQTADPGGFFLYKESAPSAAEHRWPRGGSSTCPFRVCGPDVGEALRAVGRDHGLLRDVIGSFLDEFPRLLEEIETAIAEGDVAAVRSAAHTLKCSLRLFGVNPGRIIAEQLMGINRCTDALAWELLDKLCIECARARRGLRLQLEVLEGRPALPVRKNQS